MVVIALAPFSQHVYWDAALKVAAAAKSSVQLVQSAPYAEEPGSWRRSPT